MLFEHRAVQASKKGLNIYVSRYHIISIINMILFLYGRLISFIRPDLAHKFLSGASPVLAESTLLSTIYYSVYWVYFVHVLLLRLGATTASLTSLSPISTAAITPYALHSYHHTVQLCHTLYRIGFLSPVSVD